MLRLSVLFAICAALCACKAPVAAPPVPLAGYVTIHEQAIALKAELPGRTDPFAVSEIRPQISGIVKARLFVEGSTVKAGQPLYQIDPGPYLASYQSAAATLDSTKIKAARYAQLLKAQAIAPQNNDDAQAGYKQALANAEMAKINLNYTRIVAPISGRIGPSQVTMGALVTANQTGALVTISTLDPIFVDIDQSSAELLALEHAAQKGQINRDGPLTADVTLTLDDGAPYPITGKLQFTDVTVDPTTGAVRLRAIFPNPSGLLLPGLYVRAVINEGVDPHGILVPQSAVARNPKGDPTVLVLDDRNIARLRILETGGAVGGAWQVLRGLKPGDRVIVAGLQNIKPDMPVKAVPAKSAGSSAT